MRNIEQQRDGVKFAHWQILAAAALFGTSGTALGLAPESAQPAVVGVVRLGLGSFFLFFFSVAQGGECLQKKMPLVATVFAGSFLAILQYCFFGAISRTGVAVGTTIFIGSYPIFAGLLGLLVRKEYLCRQWLVATILSVLGCSLLIGGGQGNTDFLGVSLALGAGGSYAVYSVIIKGLLKGRSTAMVIAVVSFLGAVFLCPVLFTANLSWLSQPNGIAVCLYLGLATTAVPYWLFARGVKVVQVSTAATLNLAEPLMACLLGVFLLGEQLTATVLTGMALLLGGLLIITFKGVCFTK